MPIKRRKLLQTGLTGLVLAPLAPLAGVSATATARGSIKAYAVTNDLAMPLIPRGTWILADTAATTWSGPGLYLYPHWGQPRAYRVTRAQKQEFNRSPALEFRDPASGNILWTVTQTPDARFAGKICALGCESPTLAHLHLDARLDQLKVPQLPQGNPTFL